MRELPFPARDSPFDGLVPLIGDAMEGFLFGIGFLFDMIRSANMLAESWRSSRGWFLFSREETFTRGINRQH